MAGGGWTVGDYLDRPLRDLLDDVAGSDSVPAAGSMVAAIGALAAGLAAKVARRSRQLDERHELAAHADSLRARFEELITADAENYAATLNAATVAERDAALLAATAGPVTVAETAAVVAEIAARLTADGNQNLRYDAAASAWIAASIAEVAATLAGANVGETVLFERAQAAADKARAAADRARA